MFTKSGLATVITIFSATLLFSYIYFIEHEPGQADFFGVVFLLLFILTVIVEFIRRKLRERAD
jgi:O-antigen/teichoic acid export membrane protein